MEKSIVVIIPNLNFFYGDNSVGGHINHFKGVLSGFAKHRYSVTVVGPDWSDYPQVANVIELGAKINSFSRVVYIFKVLLSCWLLHRNQKQNLFYIRHSLSFSWCYPVISFLLPNARTVIEVNSIRSSSIISNLERFFLSYTNFQLCVSSKVKALLGDNFSASSVIIPNGVDLERFDRGTDCAVKEPKGSSALQIGYFGAIKEDYGLQTICEWFGRLKSHNVHFNVYGSGSLLETIQTKNASNLNVSFWGAVKPDKVPGLMLDQDALLYTGYTCDDFQSPIKIFEYMACGRPIIANAINQVGKIMGDDAFYFSLEDYDSFCSAIDQITINSVYLADMCQKNKIKVKAYDWSHRISDLLDFLGQSK